MAKTFRVYFYLRSNYVNKEGKTPIMLRIFHGKDYINMGGTGVAVVKSDWDTKSGRAKRTCVEVNNQLSTIEADLTKIFRMAEYDENFSLQMVKTRYLEGDKATETQLLQYWDKFITAREEEMGKTISAASIQKYKVTRKHFADFIKHKLHRSDIALAELGYEVISEFQHYMISVVNNCNNTTMRMLRTFKTVIIKAHKEGLIDKDPFSDVRIHFDPVDRGFLTEEEIANLAQKDFGIKRLEQVRDYFVFSCYTGLAYIDMANLKWENIKDMDGTKWIIASRQKTKVSCNVPLLPIPLMLLEKYKGTCKDGKIFPIISNQKTNSFLKEIGAACGIDKELTFHLARHTFATLALTKGVAVESVSKMLGHTNIKTTQVYARITNEKVKNDMLALNSRLNTINTSGSTEGTIFSAKSAVASPQKPREAAAPVPTTAPPSVEPAEKPRRGRPRKVALVASSATIATDTKTATPAPAKKRGRPRKNVS